MRKVKFLVLIIVLTGMGRLNAQGVDLRLDSNSLSGLPSVVNMNSSYSLFVRIYNDSLTPFVGIITMQGRINDSLVTASVDTSFSNVLVYANAQTTDSIGPGGSILRSLVFNIQNPPFIIGTSGVVIWPKVVSVVNPLLTVTIVDTLTRNLSVTYPVGLDELTERNLKVYMNNQQLIIQNQGKYLLKSVKLYDVSGKLLLEQPISISGVVNMDQYASGVYLAEMNFEDNTRVICKVFSTR